MKTKNNSRKKRDSRKKSSKKTIKESRFSSESFLENSFDKKPSKTNMDPKRDKQSKTLFWLMLPVGLLFILSILKAGGFSLWFVVSIFLWFAYLYNIKRSRDLGVFSLGKMIIFGIIILVLSFLVVDAAPSDVTKISQTTNTTR